MVWAFVDGKKICAFSCKTIGECLVIPYQLHLAASCFLEGKFGESIWLFS